MERRVTFQPAQGLSPPTKVWLDSKKIPRAKVQFPTLEQVMKGGHMTVQVKGCPCICDRPKKFIVCKKCGYRLKGRVRKTCVDHPNTIFLMDFDHCPGCLAGGCVLDEYSDGESES